MYISFCSRDHLSHSPAPGGDGGVVATASALAGGAALADGDALSAEEGALDVAALLGCASGVCPPPQPTKADTMQAARRLAKDRRFMRTNEMPQSGTRLQEFVHPRAPAPVRSAPSRDETGRAALLRLGFLASPSSCASRSCGRHCVALPCRDLARMFRPCPGAAPVVR